MKYISLSYPCGLKIPIVGLGTWKAADVEIQKTLIDALNCGYRHIDTAFNYNNEEVIGDTIKEWVSSKKGERSDLFITTKLPNVASEPSDVEKYLNLSLNRLKLDYIDLYLIHMPFSIGCDEKTLTPAKNEDGTYILKNNNNINIWKAMENQVKKGLIKSIGLSNFNAQQIKKIYDSAEIKPSVLQIEIHAYLQQTDLLEFCKSLKIAVTAYAPLGSPAAYNHFLTKYNYKKENFPNLLNLPLIKSLADKYNRTTGQILLRHLIQKEIVVIPKSTNKTRIAENITLFDFELECEDVKSINELDKGEQGRIFDFLFFKGVENHPEYPFDLNKIS